MGHLLAKRLDCILDKSLLSVNIEFTIAILSKFSKSPRSCSELVEVGEVLVIDVAKDMCKLLDEGGALTIERKEMSVRVAGDVAHLI